MCGSGATVEVKCGADGSPEPTVASRSEVDNRTRAAAPTGACNGETAVEVAVERQGLNIDSLPDELMLNVFSFCSFNELIDVVQNVCLRWKRLAHDPVLWWDKEYVIRGRAQNGRSCCGVICTECVHCRCEKTDEEVLRTVSAIQQLRTFTMMRGTKADILRKICENSPNLTTLHLHGCQKMNYLLLKYIFEKCPKIEKLIIASSLLADRQYAEMVSSLEHLKSLEVFYNQKDVRSVQLRFLANACPRLEEIKLQWDYRPLEDIEYFMKVKKDSLTSATLHWTTIGKRCVVPVLKECAGSLEKLELNGYDLVPEEEGPAFAALGELHNLRDLYMYQLYERHHELISLAFKPGCLPLLQRLDMPYAAGLQDDTVLTISQGCPCLRELRLKFSTSITDKALGKIHCLKHLQIVQVQHSEPQILLPEGGGGPR